MVGGLWEDEKGVLDDLYRFWQDVMPADGAAKVVFTENDLQRLRFIAAQLNVLHRKENIEPFDLLGLVFPMLTPADYSSM